MRKALLALLAFVACASAEDNVRSIAHLKAEREQVICDNAFWIVLNASWNEFNDPNDKNLKEQYDRCRAASTLGEVVKHIFSQSPGDNLVAKNALLQKSIFMPGHQTWVSVTLNDRNAPLLQRLGALRLFLANDHAANRFLARMLSDETRMNLFLQGKPVPLYPVPELPKAVRDQYDLYPV